MVKFVCLTFSFRNSNCAQRHCANQSTVYFFVGYLLRTRKSFQLLFLLNWPYSTEERKLLR